MMVMISCFLEYRCFEKGGDQRQSYPQYDPRLPSASEFATSIAANGRIAVVKVAIINQQVMNSIINKVAEDQLEYLASLSSNLPTGEIQVIKSRLMPLDTGIRYGLSTAVERHRVVRYSFRRQQENY